VIPAETFILSPLQKLLTLGWLRQNYKCDKLIPELLNNPLNTKNKNTITSIQNAVRFKGPRAAIMKTTVFRYMMPYSLVDHFQHTVSIFRAKD
jgi:hypothetical protein